MKRKQSGNNNNPLQQQPSFYNQQTFPTPGQFQAPPPPFNNPPTYNGPQKPPHNFRGWVLAIFVICFAFSWVDIVVENMAINGLPSSTGALSGFATILFIVVNIGIIILDGRSFFSLFGRIRWRSLKGWQKPVLGILYLCGVIMPGIYLFFTIQNFRRISQQTVGSWYQSKSKNSRISIAAVSLLSLIFFATLTGSMASYDRTNALLALTSTATAQQHIAQSTTQTSTTSSQNSGSTPIVGTTPTVIPTATATPKPSPTHQPTPTPTRVPQPTPRPTQPPACQAVNGNPWCYNFTPGNYITSPPSNFCSYFSCIASFWNGHGHVEECQDTEYSLSGGIQGSCSHHGGNLQPLYSH